MNDREARRSECFCGRLIKQQPLPRDIADAAGQDSIWLHSDGGLLCYPYDINLENRKARAEPVEGR